MSDWDDEDAPPTDLEGEEVEFSLASEELRDTWIDFLLSQNEREDWVEAQVLRDGDNMVVRTRWADGREEVYDLIVRRSMEVVRPAGDEGSN